MKEFSIEKLKEMFPVQNVAPYGDCVVVPGSKFDPDWEAHLGDQGYKCFPTDLDQKPVTLVQLKPMKAKVPASLSGIDWTAEEDERLTQLWNAKTSVPDMVPNFPERTANAIRVRATRLQRKGKIQPRWHHDKGIEPTTTAPSTPTSASAHAPIINTSLTIQLSVNCNDKNAVANFIKIIEKLGAAKK